MAVDEILLGWASRSQECVVRCYRWEVPTLSLGYFQAHDHRRRHPPSLASAVVRRVSGGGAILHDAELTYSIALPGGHPLARRRLALYRAAHEAVVEVLAELGLSSRLCQGELSSSGEAPFLCFRRRSVGDVLCGEAKVAGSAQRRLAGAILQHGSVLLGRSPAAPELPGVEDLGGMPMGAEAFAHRWLDDLAERLGWRWQVEPLSQAEQRATEALVTAKYGHAGWTTRR